MTLFTWVLGSLSFLYAFRSVSDLDVAWHIAAGRWMWQHHAVVTADPFSFTAHGQPWVSIPWAYQLIVAALYDHAGGLPAVVAFHALAAALAVGLAWKTFETLAGDSAPALTRFAGAIVFLAGISIVELRWHPRPEVLALLWGAASLSILVRGEARAVRWLPLLQLAWVNTHATFWFGPFLIFLFWIPRRDWRSPLFRAGLLAGAACLLNPRGINGALFPFRLLGQMHDPLYHLMLAEIRGPFADPIWSYDSWGLLATIALLLAAILLLGWRSAIRQRDWPFALLTPVLIWMSFAGRRNIALLVLWTLPWAAELVARTLRKYAPLVDIRWEMPVPSARQRQILGGTALLGVFAIGLNVVRAPGNPDRFGAHWAPLDVPVRAIDFLKETHATGKLFASMELADFSLLRYPTLPVYIDGRVGEVYEPARFRRYQDVLAHPPLIEEEARTWGIDLIAVLHGDVQAMTMPFIAYLANQSKWKLVYLDEVAVVFVRQGKVGFGDTAPAEIARQALASLASAQEVDGLRADWRARFNARGRVDRARAWTRLSDVLVSLGQLDAANQAVEKALNGDQSLAAAWMSACRIDYLHCEQQAAQHQGKAAAEAVEQTQRSCQRALADRESGSAAYQILGLLALNTGQPNEAISHFENSVRHNPLAYESYFMLAQAYARLGDPNFLPRVLWAYGEAARLRPYAADALVQMGLVLMHFNRRDEARTALQAALARQRSPEIEKLLAENEKAARVPASQSPR